MTLEKTYWALSEVILIFTIIIINVFKELHGSGSWGPPNSLPKNEQNTPAVGMFWQKDALPPATGKPIKLLCPPIIQFELMRIGKAPGT